MHPYRTHAAFAAKRLSALFVVVIVLAAVDVPLNAPADVQTAFKRDPAAGVQLRGERAGFERHAERRRGPHAAGTELVFGPCFGVPLPEAFLKRGPEASFPRIRRRNWPPPSLPPRGFKRFG